MHYDEQQRRQKEDEELYHFGGTPLSPRMEYINKMECRNKILAMLQEVVNDTMQVFDFGAKKHADSGLMPNFLTVNGNKCSLHDRGSSILRHSARTFMHPETLDAESGLPELLHLLSSAAIMYIRQKRNIIHPNDDNTI